MRKAFNNFSCSSIEHGGTSTVFYMMDQYFSNDSLEPFESKFIGSTGLAMVYLWLSWPSLMRGYQNIFQYVGIFMRFFADGNLCVGLLVGEFYMVPLAYDNGMVPR